MIDDDIIYEEAERQDDGLIKANLEIKSVALDGPTTLPEDEQKEASGSSPELKVYGDR